MPLNQTNQPPTLDGNGDIAFTMIAADGKQIPVVAVADYIIAMSPTNEGTDTRKIFDHHRDEIELSASEQYDLHGVDERGVVRLAPLIF